MTEAEKNEIVGLVMTKISSQAVDFDIATEQPQANDLLTAVRQTSSGEYMGVTLKWDDVARIATELANQAAKRAEQAETDANNILTQVQSKGTDITNFVATSKTEIETQKNESVNAVKSVYQTDLNELKGDLIDLYDKEISVETLIENTYILPNGKTDTSNGSFATDFIEVKSGRMIAIDNVYLEGNRSICMYDYNKKFVPNAIYNTSEKYFEITIPLNVCYIRVTGKMGTDLVIEYKDDVIKKDIQNITASISDCLTKKILPSKKYVGIYFYPDGTLRNDVNTTVSYLFKVDNNSTVIAKGVYGESTRSICAFDSNGDFVKEITKPVGDYTNFDVRIIVDGFDYIGLSTTNGNDFYVEYENKYTTISDNATKELSTNENVGNYVESNININLSKFGIGYIYYDGRIEKVISDSSYLFSPGIEVFENQEIEFSCGFAPNGQIAHFFDSDFSYVKSLNISTVGEYNTPTKIVVPFNVKYMRFNIKESQKTIFDVKYVNKVYKNYFPSSIVEGWYNSAFKKIGTLFDKAVNKPIITFIDDDTVNIEAVTLYHDACVNAGIKGGYACITQNLDVNEGLADQLLAYEREGFHTTYHCHTQSNFYRLTNRDSVALENDFVMGLQKMKSYGFTDYNLWCTPYGVSDDEIQNLARKWGMECLVTSGSNEYETTEAKHGRFSLKRISLEPTDTEGGFNISDIKQVITEASKVNGWVLITTHFSAWTSEGFPRFKELVDHAIANGFEVKTLNEAWRIRKPIYEFYEMF